MNKIIKTIFKLEILILFLGILIDPQKAISFFKLDSIINPQPAVAQKVECLFPSCFPSCFPPCLPTCSPRPTPTGVVPTPTSGEPTPTLPAEPSPTSPPAVGGNGGSEPGPASPPGCGSQTPAAPYLKSVSKIKTDEVELLWDPVEPVTHYAISYGPSSGEYLYGVSNTGKVTSYKIGALGGGNYCFVIRAVNDCAPSEASNEICTGRATPQVLGVSVLGATGGARPELWQVFFIIGGVCSVLGVKIASSKQKQARF